MEIIKSHPAMSNLIVGRPPLEVQVTEKAISVRILLSQNLLPKSKTQARGDINFRDTRTRKRQKKSFLTESIGSKFFLNIWKK